MSPPSYSQSLSHLLCQICVHPLVLLGGKTVGPRAPVSKVESKTFHRRKGTLQAFSRSSDIDELVLRFFWGLMIALRVFWRMDEALALANELPEEAGQFRFLRAACLPNLKGSVGFILAKASAMRIFMPLDLSSRPFIPLPRLIRSSRQTPPLAPSLVFFPPRSV